jgi:hypothetical protein
VNRLQLVDLLRQKIAVSVDEFFELPVVGEKLPLVLSRLLKSFSLRLDVLDRRQQLVHQISLQNQHVLRIVEDLRSDRATTLHAVLSDGSTFHVIIDLNQLNVLVLDQLRVRLEILVLQLERLRHRRVVQVRVRLAAKDLAELHEERAELSVILLVAAQLEHSMRQRVSLIDESLAEADEAQAESFALLALEAKANDGEGVAAAALVLVHDQLRLLEADQQQEEIRVVREFRALMRDPEIREGELTHAVDARIVLESFTHDRVDDLPFEVQRLAQIRQHFAANVDKLLESRSRDAVVVVFGDVKVCVDELMVGVDRRKLAEDQHRQLQLFQRQVLLTFRIEDVPEEVGQDRDGMVELEALVLDVETRLLSGVEDIVKDVCELARTNALLRL